jgi:hypothetical protein
MQILQKNTGYMQQSNQVASPAATRQMKARAHQTQRSGHSGHLLQQTPKILPFSMSGS